MMRDDAHLFATGQWKFVGQPIAVVLAGEPTEPIEFSWRGRSYRIAEILITWFDWGFPAGSTQRDWRTRRHRRYFRVATDRGEVFEIYHDRRGGGEGGDWVCYQQWVIHG